jgi:hypothetical protein
MKQSLTISLVLASFDTIRTPGDSNALDFPGLLFFSIGADTRAAVTAADSQHAFRFALMGIHEDEKSAKDFVDNIETISSWVKEAKEIWSAVLQPFHHKGEANYLNKENPGKLFDVLAESPGTNVPVVVITTAGWATVDMNRVKEFGDGAAGVRISMTAVDGLHSQQSFFFPGLIALDPMTVTLWRDAVSVGKFAYGQHTHRMQLDKQNEKNIADRTSFTRCKILSCKGTWHQTDPTKWN